MFQGKQHTNHEASQAPWKQRGVVAAGEHRHDDREGHAHPKAAMHPKKHSVEPGKKFSMHVALASDYTVSY